MADRDSIRAGLDAGSYAHRRVVQDGRAIFEKLWQRASHARAPTEAIVRGRERCFAAAP